MPTASIVQLLLFTTMVISNLFALRIMSPVANRQTKRFLNRILCEADECRLQKGDEEYFLDLPSGDYRAEHIKKILKLKEDDHVKVGGCCTLHHLH